MKIIHECRTRHAITLQTSYRTTKSLKPFVTLCPQSKKSISSQVLGGKAPETPLSHSDKTTEYRKRNRGKNIQKLDFWSLRNEAEWIWKARRTGKVKLNQVYRLPHSPPYLLRCRYLGRSDFADAGFLCQRPDAANKAERVCELLPAGFEDWALRRWHKLCRVAPCPHARHGNTGGEGGRGFRGGKQVEKGRLKPTKTFHVPWQGPKLIFSDKNCSTQEPQNRFLLSFVIVSFGAFPHRARTFRKLKCFKIPPPHQESLRGTATPRRTTFFLPLSQQPSVAPCILVRESSALANDFKRHTLTVPRSLL